MNQENDIIKNALSTFQIFGEAVKSISSTINTDAINFILSLKGITGKVVFTGIGKSGLIGKKAAATFASTGTRSIFLHPTEALHGDLGMIGPSDFVIMLSKSGESDELYLLTKALKNLNITTSLISFNGKSSLNQFCDFVITLPEHDEICPFNIAPTTSTIQTLAFLDFVAIEIMKLRKFTPTDFASLHPSGRIGKRLLLNVEDVMVSITKIAQVDYKSTFKDTMLNMSSCGYGLAFVYQAGKFLGILTDGDIRRALTSSNSELEILSHSIERFVTMNPLAIDAKSKAIDGVKYLEDLNRNVAFLIVMNDNREPVGIVRPHDFMGIK